MGDSNSRIIDIFCHILPPKYKKALYKKAKPCFALVATDNNPALSDIDMRLRVMDKYEGLSQILTMGIPPLEYVVGPRDAIRLAMMANDEMAELVIKYPERFISAAAILPMNDMDAALRETDRAIKELGFKGIQISTSINGKPLDSPEFLGLYHKMEEYDLPIWIHPTRDWDVPDYPGEEKSKYKLFATFGWPYETTIAMARLVFGGVLEKCPNVKFITHHCGGMIPYFAARLGIRTVYDEPNPEEGLSKPAVEYLQTFYGDTALSGSSPGLMCGHAFFGTEHMLFASDYPYGGPRGELKLIRTIESVNSMAIPQNDKEKIFHKNAESLLRLPM